MIKFFKRNRTFRLRAIRAYLLIILACTLFLFFFTIISLEPTHPRNAESSREMWYAGLATVMLLCAMGIGLKLLINVSWDIRWFQLRSDFVSGVSHEFKTPLSLIRLYSETLATANQA